MKYFDWLSWQNPVAIWWIFLTCIAVLNIFLWIWTRQYLKRQYSETLLTKYMVWLSSGYVFVCAFRSFIPRADVLRTSLFDTWLSNVFVGRSVATVAELCFIAQWAVVLYCLSTIVQSKAARVVSMSIFPIICIAECFSWYAVITTHYLGNTLEESLWAVTYSLIAICLIFLVRHFKGALKYAIAFAIFGSLLYVTFMVTVDVPMYFHRWQQDLLLNKPLLGFFEGIHDLQTKWIVTHEIADWKEEIPWMTLYFSVAVWTSIALCFVPLTRSQLQK